MGVFVIGMHRSGTSAATELLAAMGLNLGDPAGLMPATNANAHGYFEVLGLTAENDAILSELGGDALVPPVPSALASLNDSPPTRFEKARTLFHGHLGGSGWVWKDPRNCLLIKFWRRAVPGEHQAVVILRDPLEVADSLTRRGDTITALAAVALWEVYMASAMSGLEAMPTMVTTFDQLIANPEVWCDDVGAFLNGIQDDYALDPPASTGLVDPSMRRSSKANVDLTPQQIDLDSIWKAALGPHESFHQDQVHVESPTTTIIMNESRMSVKSRIEMKGLLDAQHGHIDQLHHELTHMSEELERRGVAIADAVAEFAHRQRLLDQFILKTPAHTGESGELEQQSPAS